MPLSSTKSRASGLFRWAAVALGAVLVLGAASVSWYVSSTRWVEHTLEVRVAAYDWLARVLDAETLARGYVVSGRPEFVDSYRQAAALVQPRGASLSQLVSDNPLQAQAVARASRDTDVIMQGLERQVALFQSSQREAAVTLLGADKVAVDAFRDDLRLVVAQEEGLLAQRRMAARWRGQVAMAFAVLLALGSFGLLAMGWQREGEHRRALTGLALQARARLERIAALAARLAETRTVAQVAEVVIDQGVRAVDADTCTLYMLDPTGTELRLIGDRGVAPEILDKIRSMTASEGNPEAFAAMKKGEPRWAESVADYQGAYPTLAGMKERKVSAFWSVPLLAEDRTIGLLGAGYVEPRQFSEDERAFVQTLANQCAQALVRATRLEREGEAERWLATTLKSIGDAVIATDEKGRVSFMNPVAESLTGWPEPEARGRPLDEVFSIFSEQTREVVESPVTKVLREGNVVGLANHTVLRTRQGIDLPIDDSGAPIRNDKGAIAGVVLVFRDASAEKRDRARSEFLARAGEALVGSLDYEATLATVASLAVPSLADWCSVELHEPDRALPRQVAVAHVDPAKVQMARELGERYPPDPNAKTGAAEVIRSGKAQLFAEIPAALLEQGARDAEHLRIIRDLRLQSAMVVPLHAHGRTFGAMTFVYADSGRRYSEDDLAFAEDFARRAAMAIENAVVHKEVAAARANEKWHRTQAEIASRSKDEFLATVSHELRTPLNGILGWTVIARAKNPPPEIDKALGIIERNARAQAKLIADVLDVSRIISGKLSLNLRSTKVAAAVAAAIETVTPAATAKGIAIRSQIDDDTLVITADTDRLQQIVWNLLANAVKFTPKGGEVRVLVRREGSDIVTEVSDTGEGIHPEALPFVFDPFRQADASITRRHGGLGLGLAIVKQLVLAHGGSVEARSAGKGQGATFSVQIPARVVPLTTAQQPAAREATEAGPSPKNWPRLDRLRLLVVDDEPDSLSLVSEVLASQGAEVHVAGSAIEALEKLSRVKPDVFVSDIGMPEVDGYTLIRKIRSLAPEAGGKTPAIALTAYARASDAERAFAAGYQMHVSKPVEPSQLITLVANLGGRTTDEA